VLKAVRSEAPKALSRDADVVEGVRNGEGFQKRISVLSKRPRTPLVEMFFANWRPVLKTFLDRK